MTQRPNIVQVDFFHTKASSIEELLEQCAERARDGSPIKTCVRFYDEEGAMTKVVQGLSELQQKKMLLREKVFCSRWLVWRRIQNWRHQQLIGSTLAAKEILKMLILAQLTHAVNSSKEVAVEGDGHLLHFVRRDERHELIESVSKATSMWVFVFKHNDLLSRKNEMVAKIM